MIKVRWAVTLFSIVIPYLSYSQVDRMSINDGWLFSLDCDSLENRRQWERINLPHTWNTDAYEVMDYHKGTGYYTKSFALPSLWKNKRLYLEFEGVNKAADVFVNGTGIGSHVGGYSSFRFDITDYVHSDTTNTIKVIVDNDREDIAPTEADFTFFGGIYRDVWLESTSPVHFDRTNHASDGVFISTPSVSDEEASLSVRGKIRNESSSPRKLILKYTIVNPEGKNVYSSHKEISIEPNGEYDFDYSEINIPQPILWSPETPNLYHIDFCLSDADTGETFDKLKLKTAFRWFSFDAKNGFFLNGKPYKLRGICRHQDQEPVGPALTDDMHRRDMRMMKEMGANFIRISHYPQDKAILDMCDELGLLAWEEIPVINIVPDVWGYDEHAAINLREMIRQHYNHPSVIMWGYMNEILLFTLREPEEKRMAAVERAYELAQQLEKIAREEDPYRLTTMAFHGSDDYNKLGFSTITDVVGWNIYNGWYGEEFHDLDKFMEFQHENYPSHPIIISEYGAGGDRRIHSFQPKRFDFSTEYQQKFIEYYLPYIERTPYIMGASYWNFIDFSAANRQESMPRINNKGLVRSNREPKDVYYYFKATWRDDIPVVHIAARDWNRRTLLKDSTLTTMPLKIYSNSPTVELFVNGESQGTKEVVDSKAIFDIPVENGKISLIARGTHKNSSVEDAMTLELRVISNKLPERAVDFPEIGINVGSNCYFTGDISAFTWFPDQEYQPGSWGYIGGTVMTTTAEIKGTPDDPLYQTQRCGIKGYRFDVNPGKYEVEVHFADYSKAKSSDAYLFEKRENGSLAYNKFDITLNGEHIETLSPASSNDSFTAFSRTYIYDNDTDSIEIGFEPISGETFLNAVRIRKIMD